MIQGLMDVFKFIIDVVQTIGLFVELGGERRNVFQIVFKLIDVLQYPIFFHHRIELLKRGVDLVHVLKQIDLFYDRFILVFGQTELFQLIELETVQVDLFECVLFFLFGLFKVLISCFIFRETLFIVGQVQSNLLFPEIVDQG